MVCEKIWSRYSSSRKEEEIFINWVYFDIFCGLGLVIYEMNLEVWNSAWASCMQMKRDILFLVTKVDCSQSLIFPWDSRCQSLTSTGRHLGLLMRAKLRRVQNARGWGWWRARRAEKNRETVTASLHLVFKDGGRILAPSLIESVNNLLPWE